MKKLFLPLFLFGLCFHWAIAQETFPRNDVEDKRLEAYAFINATIYVDHATKLENATLLIKDGKVINVGADLKIPAAYTTYDLAGKWVYPALIDMYTSYGMPEVKRPSFSGFNSAEQIESKTPGPYNANQAIKSEFNAVENFEVDEKEAESLRKLGFGAALTFRPDGVARGSSALVCLGEDRENVEIIADQVAAHYSFNRGSSTQMYPVSAMGLVSLLRQTYLDAKWYGAHKEKPFADKSLDAWLNLQKYPQIFEATGWLSLLRADKIGDEFGVQYVIKGGGDSYQRIRQVKATGATLIVPVDFPAAFDVSDPLDAYKLSFADMKHWELAPTNLSHIEKNGIDFAITTHGLKNKNQFWDNLRKAIKHGLSEKGALKALTATPAKLLGVQDQVGNLQKGALANFIITSGNLFNEQTTVYENWVQGKRFSLQEMHLEDKSGQYELVVNAQSHVLEITGQPGKHQAKIVVNDTTDLKVSLTIDGDLVGMSFNPNPKDENGLISLSGWIESNGFAGNGQLADGSWAGWTAVRNGEPEVKKERKKQSDDGQEPEIGEIIYPFVAYGNKEIPKPENILIKNATVWTMEDEGVLENADVLIQNGKISRIGKNLNANGAKIVDGANKHVTPGIIDEHTHIGGGGNERLTNSAMVRIGDQINSEDQNIYRALSGGVTSVQVLHGSANPIGGQSELIKLRWGMGPEELKIEGADEYIKFALGENVKRSRSNSSIRYPRSRMGVEQVYVDAFSQALEYEKKWTAYKNNPKGKVAPRRDLAMDAMLEIIREKRFITCHSYVQSEINMLMKVAEKFDFKINTFTHILEGYKLADKMAEHGAGASSFSDWWAYKWEVRYAIPYNATIMAREGVVTAINSDDREMMRRLNQEAAKSVKYGNLSEEEALKMVTINPAKLLHLDKQTGSLKAGKDADVVLWSDHPLSIYARPEKTIVDGTIYFDVDKDQEMKLAIERERGRLIQKMRNEKSNGRPTQRAMARIFHEMHCEDVVLYNGEN